MIKNRNWHIFIDDILEAIEKIEKYVKDKNFEQFNNDDLLFDGVIRNFEIMGEAANNVPYEIQEKYNFVEWTEMIGFRNVLIHNYFGIDTETVWQTIKKNIPEVKMHVLELKSKERI
jgi:uncharacterized protein with HEPN domain